MIPAGTLRQSVFPPAWLGRTAAVFHVVRGGMSVAGALLGGLLGQVIGVRETLLVSAMGLTLAMLIPLFSPLRSLKTIPETPD
jgi:prolipoprotein diacylglyceryltransferase